MKKEILDAILGELKHNSKAYLAGQQTLNTDIDLDENALVEIDDISQKDQATDISEDLLIPAASLDNLINAVKNFQTVSKNTLGPGALVETREMYLLIGVALPPLQVNGKKVIGVTEGGRIYPSLQGKKQGDKFELGNRSFLILSVL